MNSPNSNSETSDDNTNYDRINGNNPESSMRPVISNSNVSIGCSSLYNQCFSANHFPSQYEEECPVNYSLKYSETESCKINAENSKTQFKEFSDYAETDLDQPTNFSWKYGEKPEEAIKSSKFIYFENEKPKYKEYADYAETDLDQPTDFTLKYGELCEEVKSPNFTYFENKKLKATDCCRNDSVRDVEVLTEPSTDHFVSENETPLMFSRSSSLNSLSSFDQVTGATPDDIGSVISEFSRTTSGIITPSDLPDSPIQTVPPSPNQNKPRKIFPVNENFQQKKSVFEDDVASYKQEDTPIEFSRATSLSSLFIDNSLKSECCLNLQTNSMASSVSGCDVTKSKEISQYSKILNNVTLDNLNKNDIIQREGLMLQILESSKSSQLDKILAERISSIKINDDSESKCSDGNEDVQESLTVPESKRNESCNSKLPKKATIQSVFSVNNGKVFPAYEGSDDDVHTYHTEGTPANISHVGSHSDLSALSMVSAIPPSRTEENSEEGSLCSENEAIPAPNPLEVPKEVYEEANIKSLDFLERSNNNCSRSEISVKLKEEHSSQNQGHEKYLGSCNSLNSQKDTTVHETSVIKDELPLEFSAINCVERSSYLKRSESFRNSTGQIESSLNYALIRSSSDLGLRDLSATIKKKDNINSLPLEYSKKSQCWFDPELLRCEGVNFNEVENDMKASVMYEKEIIGPRIDISSSLNIDGWTAESCTAFEEVLVEQCINLGMPQKTKKSDKNKFNTAPEKDIESWSVETCTPFEEALVEQCIRLGMPQKNQASKVEDFYLKSIHEKKNLKIRDYENFSLKCEPVFQDEMSKCRRGDEKEIREKDNGKLRTLLIESARRRPKNLQGNHSTTFHSSTAASSKFAKIGIANWSHNAATHTRRERK